MRARGGRGERRRRRRHGGVVLLDPHATHRISKTHHARAAVRQRFTRCGQHTPKRLGCQPAVSYSDEGPCIAEPTPAANQRATPRLSRRATPPRHAHSQDAAQRTRVAGSERREGRIERLRVQLAYGFEARTQHQLSSSWQTRKGWRRLRNPFKRCLKKVTRRLGVTGGWARFRFTRRPGFCARRRVVRLRHARPPRH